MHANWQKITVSMQKQCMPFDRNNRQHAETMHAIWQKTTVSSQKENMLKSQNYSIHTKMEKWPKLHPTWAPKWRGKHGWYAHNSPAYKVFFMVPIAAVNGIWPEGYSMMHTCMHVHTHTHSHTHTHTHTCACPHTHTHTCSHTHTHTHMRARVCVCVCMCKWH